MTTPTMGGEAVRTITEPMRQRPMPPAATPEDEARFVALQRTDERQQAEINELDAEIAAIVARIATMEKKAGDGNGYVFKPSAEFAWSLGIGVLGFLLTALTEAGSITDWGPWLVGLGTGLLRFVIGFLLDWQRRHQQHQQTPA